MNNGSAYLTLQEVAKKFGITPSTVYRLVREGQIPGFKIGGQWRFSQKILETWIDNQFNKGKPPS